MNRLKIIVPLLIAVMATRSRSLPLAALQAGAPLQAGPAQPLLTNGGFEGGWHRATMYWTPTGGPYSTQFGEIAPPTGWVAWWREGFTCAGTPDYRTGRPEVRVITAVPDPERIHSGDQATQFFTFWRCHDGGLLQQVAVEQSRYYTLRAFGHAWYSRCSTKPHDPPLDTDCVTPITWAQDWLNVGIDPTGGIDPMAPTVQWGTPQQVYGVYSDEPLTTGHIQAQAGIVTVFLRSEASHPLKHNNVYWEDVTLHLASRTFLPIIRSDR